MISGHAGKGRLLDFGVLGDITEGPSKNVFYQIRSAEDLGSFVDVQICTETSKSAATIEKRHSTPDGNVSLYHLHYFLSHRLQYTLFGNMMFLFEGKWIVDCSKYSDRQPLRSFFHKQARFKCTVANAKLSFKTCEKKRLRTSKSQTFKNNECVLKWLPISVLYISIGCLQFLWCSYQPQPCIRARFLLCEFVNWYQRLYCVMCTWLWFWEVLPYWSTLLIKPEYKPRSVYIYIYMYISIYIHCMYTSIFGPLMALPGSTHEI